MKSTQNKYELTFLGLMHVNLLVVLPAVSAFVLAITLHTKLSSEACFVIWTRQQINEKKEDILH